MSRKVWYSGATDVTGELLAQALGADGSKTKPSRLTSNDIVLCWGTKTDSAVGFPNGVHVLNQPDKIRSNRNKINTLQNLSAVRALSGCIAPFEQSNRDNASNIITAIQGNRSKLKLPVVGRTKFHQGGKGFWLCLTKQHVTQAKADGANYFQNFIDIKTEYRLHIAFGNLIYAVKKVENASEASWKAPRKEKILKVAAEAHMRIDDSTIDYVLSRMFKEADVPNRIIRSNHRGWKFSGIQASSVTAALKDAAIKAVESVGLDFGAVDCAIDTSNNPYIIEINSGPGLEGTALQKYVDAFSAKMADLERPSAPRRAAAAVGRAVRPRPAAAAAGAGAGGGITRVFRNVQNDEEAQAVIAALMRGDI